MIYFEPLLIEHGDFNMPELDRLNKKYGNKNITFEPRQKIFVEVSHIRLHHAYSIFTSYRRLKRKIDLLIDIVLTEGLQPISEGDVQKLIIQDPYLHGPTIESFTEGLVED
jgi:hypothetical protein